MERRDKLLKKDPLRLVTVRKTMKVVAQCLSDVDSADEYLETLIEELKRLKERNLSSMVWGQVTENLDYLVKYELNRIGFIPKETE